MGNDNKQSQPPNLSDPQIERYSRQILLPQVGGRGQKKLLASRVAIVGAGGLGSPVALYLAAAGVGTLDIIDSDAVELNNLQRQIIHNQSRIGSAKASSAQQTIAALNPDVTVNAHVTALNESNALELFRDADVVIDGSDNFPTRYLVNDACWFLGKPLVSGALLRFEGQLTVFPMTRGGAAPCYRCLFPEPPSADEVPSCREAGILGAVAGVIGTLQAAETMKLLLGIGEPLVGRLLLYDGLTARFREVTIPRDPDCALCGEHPTITTLRATGELPDCRI